MYEVATAKAKTDLKIKAKAVPAAVLPCCRDSDRVVTCRSNLAGEVAIEAVVANSKRYGKNERPQYDRGRYPIDVAMRVHGRASSVE